MPSLFDSLKLWLVYAGLGLFVVFFFGLCIIVHEWGHLMAALWRGLFVERFSIGFGRKIAGFVRNNVEYVVSILPFGGYVALPQLEPTDTPQTSEGLPLPSVKPVDRMLTAVAGPLGNIVFGFLLATVVWAVGVYRPPKTTACDVIDVPQSSPEYRAGLRPGDRITKVNGHTFTRGWNELAERIVLSSGTVNLDIVRDGQPSQVRYQPVPNPAVDGIGYPFFKVRSPTVVQDVLPNSAAAKAGIAADDVILDLNGKPVPDFVSFVDGVNASKGKPITLVVARSGARKTITDLCAQPTPVHGKTIYRIGVVIKPMVVLTHLSPWSQFTRVFDQTRRVLRLLFVRGSLVKPKHLSGPVGIAETIAAKVFLGGIREGLAFIVFVSFGLAMVNLFPLPVLDGGHIVFGLVELVLRRRIPARVASVLQMTFAVVLITFMLYVTYYDVRRIPRFWRAFHGESVQDSSGTESGVNTDR